MRYVLIITLLATFAFTGCSSSAPQPTNAQATNATKVNKPAPADPHKDEDNIKRISVNEAKAAVDAGTAVIVDVRSADSWKNERIKGSISTPPETFDKDAEALPKDKQLIFYCSCPHEHSAVVAAQKLEAKGSKNISALQGGTQAWKNAGYPMDGDAANKQSNSNAPAKKP